MKSVVYFFSGTGNNLAAAKKLQKELGDTDIFPVTRLLEDKVIPEKYHNVIFTVPVYFSHIPPVVSEAMSSLIFTKEQKVYTITGCGGNRGIAQQDMRALINASGKNVTYEAMLMFAGNYIISYRTFPKVYQNVTIRMANRKLKKIAGIIKEERVTKNLKEGILYREKWEPDLQKSISNLAKKALQYEVSEDCVGCGKCAAVCPVGNIEIKDGKPKFQENCQQCMACIQWCPKKAIDWEGKAKNRKRYHHKEISYQELRDFQNKKVENP